jgi:hypothetical protein
VVLEGDNTDINKKILTIFEKKKDNIFTPAELAKKSKLNSKRTRSAINSLLSQNKIERVSRGKYRLVKPISIPTPKEFKRYLKTLEKTCEIAIHELMLTESLVDESQIPEIEHQIAYFARRLVKARWDLKQGTLDDTSFDEAAFLRAKKIHQWSQYMFELTRKKEK